MAEDAKAKYPDKKILGRQGEDAAAEFLCTEGYVLIARNFRCRFGEIDIVAQDRGVLCFIEVKTRSGNAFGSGLEAVSHSKQRKMIQTALLFVSFSGHPEGRIRFDVVSVTAGERGVKKIELVKNAFECSGSHFS